MPRNFEKGTKPNNEAKAVMVSRLLIRENQVRLLEWAHLACVAESSIRKMYNSELALNGILPCKNRSIPVNDILRDRTT